ncbi:uncharacterized protein BT62DRAFT_990971 [Guyanagaster necrorhizus]|uniref:C2H2-type domain-containing protein n=1 Tax=Guyanagaster necrorhizus TaxID=856835 RepID=A0A9P7W2E0_9AGAR|nr:uncharacterized protein BT62DRAFT_990971 [Guyanagaster necrorhizus MCA 3950]KAG7451397.1 hypothetical protein BT62DRAFT_990971 [Guyanagaster necrorhizus MCA 3950]
MNSLFAVVDSLMDHAGNKVSPQSYDSTKKRYATYFPESFPNILACLHDSDDDQSTWNFKPSSSRLILRTISPEVEPESEEGPSFTPAQEIASSYRRKTLSIVIPPRANCSFLIDSSEDNTLVDASEYCSLDNALRDILDTDPKISLRRSDSLTDFKAEAFAEMLRCQLSPEDPLICPRLGCRDTVTNVKGLACHLHLHDIVDDRHFICNFCDGRYETNHELVMHPCPSGSMSAPCSPIVASLRRAFSKITSMS